MNLDKYYDLFVHRRDVFAEQQASGAYFPVRQELTVDDVAEHLAGMASYGVYVIDPEDQTVRYVVWDLDVMDEEAASFLCESVQALVAEVRGPVGREPFWSLMREFSGNKGTHVWLFLDRPVPARDVRVWVEENWKPVWTEQATANGWPLDVEVFPKQDTVPEGGFGNLVKLPFGVHAVSGKKSELVSSSGWANTIDDVQPLDGSLIPKAPDQPSRGAGRAAQGGGSPVGSSHDGPASPFPCVDAIFNEGVGQGVRDRAMFHLALYYYGHGIPEDVALDLCIRANENFQPPLPERELRQKVSSAYRGRYSSARCGTDWLVDVCPGPCKGGWQVRQSETSDLLSAVAGDEVAVEVLRVVKDAQRARLTITHPDAENAPTLVVSRK